MKAVSYWGSRCWKVVLDENGEHVFEKNHEFYSWDNLKVFILALTGVAAININRTTINSGLSIAPNVNGYTLLRLSDSERARLRNLYLKVSVAITDYWWNINGFKYPSTLYT